MTSDGRNGHGSELHPQSNAETEAMLERHRARKKVYLEINDRIDHAVSELMLMFPDHHDVIVIHLEGAAQEIVRQREAAKRERRDRGDSDR